jgi:hypothetical protein
MQSNHLKEIGRFLHGNQPISSKHKSNKHSYFAFEHMFKSFVIGCYENKTFPIYKIDMEINGNNNFNNIKINKNPYKETENFSLNKNKIMNFSYLQEANKLSEKLISVPDLKIGCFIDDNIFFLSKKEISQKVFQLKFKSDIYKFPLFLKGFDWFGRYFSLFDNELNISRNYSISMCLIEFNFKRLENLFENFKLLENMYQNNNKNIKLFLGEFNNVRLNKIK